MGFLEPIPLPQEETLSVPGRLVLPVQSVWRRRSSSLFPGVLWAYFMLQTLGPVLYCDLTCQGLSDWFVHNHMTQVFAVKANCRHMCKLHAQPDFLRVIFPGCGLICHHRMACEVNGERKMLIFFFWKLFLLKSLPISFLESSVRLLCLNPVIYPSLAFETENSGAG